MTPQTGLDRRFYDLPDGQIAALHFGPQNQPVRLIFLHANGFNAQSYRHILNRLNIHSVALDLRGHGSSNLPVPAGPFHNFHLFRDDVLAFIRRYIDGPVMLGGHSLGGAVAALCCEPLGEQVQAFMALDPPTLPRFMHVLVRIPGFTTWLSKNFSLAKKSGARRRVFPSRAFMFEHYKKKRTFAAFKDEMLYDYIDGGTRPHTDGVELCCPPEWEARIFAAQGSNLFRAAKNLPDVRLYIHALKGGASTPSARFNIRRLAGRDNVITEPNLRHLFPFEDPGYVAGHINKLLTRANLM